MTFSIVTPSFNQLDWLKLCVASVRDQVEPPHQVSSPLRVEHIIQDAGTPGIEEFAREVGVDFHRDGILVFKSQVSDFSISRYRIAIYCEGDSGMYDAVNRGLQRSKGEFCAYLNCDEQYLPGTLAAATEWFVNHPAGEVLFGDALVVDPRGEYLCGRLALEPTKMHSMVSGNLSFLTAATFFRRSLVDKGLLFNTDWKVVGDAVWALNLLKHRIPMAAFHKYMSVFVDTGDNLSTDPSAQYEKDKLRRQAPGWARRFGSLFVLAYRLRKTLAGGMSLKPHNYGIYTFDSLSARKWFQVLSPTFRWPGR